MTDRKLAIVLGFVLILTVFGWFFVRPAIILPKCVKVAENSARDKLKTIAGSPGISGLTLNSDSDFYLKSDYEYFYKKCLNERGIK